VSTTNSGASDATAYAHDGFGRIHTSTQTAAGTAYAPFTYTYSLADELTQIQYPSGRVVDYSLDSAGRTTSVNGGTGGPVYASVNSYTPAGGVSSMTLRNNVTETRTWNDRLQPTGVTASTGAGTLLSLGLYNCAYPNTTCATGNNGNLLTQTISALGLNLTQTYTYDPLNRLRSATETPSSWYQTYGYTGSGNQYIVPGQSDNFSASAFAATAGTEFNAQNQLTSAVDSAAFDSSGNGNQTAIGPYSYTWDAEGRITTSTLSGIITAYVYDGEGQRVQKITCPAGTTSCTASVSGALVTTYVYDAAGDLAAEYGAPESGRASDCGTPYCYLSVDHLGSTRLVTDSNGVVQRRYDFLPFGEEAWAGTQWGGRASAMGYQPTADGFNPKFTGQQRDPESLLDYYRARYYAPYQGRFVSPDPGNAGADTTNPQTWNGYSYVGNNPLSYTDPSGLGFGDFLGGLINDILDVVSFGVWGAITAAVNGTQPGPGPVLGIGGDIFGSIAGSVNNNQPWNEQLPIGGGVGPLNTGTVFGSGNTGPLIFSLDPAQSQFQSWFQQTFGWLWAAPVPIVIKNDVPIYGYANS
jgi:RHS repeat-associated protein